MPRNNPNSYKTKKPKPVTKKVKSPDSASKEARTTTELKGRLFSRDGRSLKQRLKDFAKGSDNFSRMGKKKKEKK